MQLLEQVRSTIRRHDLVRPAMRVLVALSGGPDSVALVHLCCALRDAGDLVIAGLAHLNHQLRDDAAADAAFCADLARSLGLPIDSGAVDVAALAADKGVSIETAAHDARYAFLREAARRAGADRVMLGHTLDDQAETVLLRLVRGAGSRGLAGMYPRHGLFVRPLLEVRRDALREFLVQQGRTWREDPTNADRSIPRNRIRAELLPLLARDFNPRIVHVLGQQAELARDEWEWVNEAAQHLAGRAVRGHSPEWEIEVEPIRSAHPALARATMRRLLEQAAPGRPITLAHVVRALALFREGADGAADFPGQRLERRGARVVLTSRRTAGRTAGRRPGVPADGSHAFCYPLMVPGDARVPEAEATISAQVEMAGLRAFAGSRTGRPGHGTEPTVAVPLDRWRGTAWTVRNRRPGDRLTWPGLGGRKKVHDLLVDRKVPRAERDRVPIVVDDHDRIVWVAGHVLAGEFRVTDPAQAVVVLRLKLWGGSA